MMMIKRSLIAAVLLLALVGAPNTAPPPPAAPTPFEAGPPAAPACEIDKLVFGRLAQLGIQPANLCSDAVFVRRAFLDVIGTLPTAQEARDFLADRSPDKRRALIDRLLERPEFADYWAMKWGDLLRVKAEFPINLWPNAVQAYNRWIHEALKTNMPYDRFARELLTASGSNFRVGPVNFYRAVQSKEPQALAQAVALTFMGTRADKWPKERLAGMAGFFTQVGYKYTGEWKEEIVYFDPARPAGKAVFPDGAPARIAPDQDPREAFANWLIDANNPWFTRNIANRAWAWLVGRGIIQEPDDIRDDNPPSNPELLAYLQRQLVADHYDLKQLFRLILNSQTYQLSSVARSSDPQAEANFAAYPLRRLEAEVLIDAICQITGTTEKYSSAIPEPFTFIPEEQRSIALGDGSISSSFLELFGRSSRDTGLESERNNRPSAAQRLHMLNSTHIQQKIQQGRGLQALLQAGRGNPREVVDNIYLAILSRYPTEEELRTVAEYARPGSTTAPGAPGKAGKPGKPNPAAPPARPGKVSQLDLPGQGAPFAQLVQARWQSDAAPFVQFVQAQRRNKAGQFARPGRAGQFNRPGRAGQFNRPGQARRQNKAGQFARSGIAGQFPGSGQFVKSAKAAKAGQFGQPGKPGPFAQPGKPGPFGQPGKAGQFARPGKGGAYARANQASLMAAPGRDAAIDLAWALFNSPEFLYRH